ncbi:inorganic phosphate transmembrane transporter [Aureococcus anophagefferens]|nr:inorganic phosphate transmembrane transporter [Aureococcus anophagefferens]
MPFSFPSMARGFGALLIITTVSEIMADRSTFEEQDFTAITIKQAVVLAAIFEFLGALLMGSSVSKTMRKGIADVECFDDNPGLLIYGMTCVILSVAIWLLLASYLEMPVSTTHSCVGGIIGMTLMARGSRCIIWNYNKNDQKDLKPLSFDDFPLARRRRGDRRVVAVVADRVAFPVVVFITVAINTCFIIIKGTKGQPKRFETQRLVREAEDGNLLPAIEVGCYVGLGAAGSPRSSACRSRGHQDTHRDVQRVEKVASIHKNAKLHDAKAESFFRFVQVFTAIVASFSHGANDVANAMGPFSAAYVAYKKGKVVPKHEMDPDTMMWILALGGAGIVVGLATSATRS